MSLLPFPPIALAANDNPTSAPRFNKAKALQIFEIME